MGWVFLFCWVLLSICIVVLGRLIGSNAILGIGAVMLMMTAMVANVG